MANEHMKGCSTKTSHWGNAVKTTMRYHDRTIRMAKIKYDKTKCLYRYGKTGSFICYWSVDKKWYSHSSF